ncbi:MAG: amidohydrolase/deacetylase family metallohydrolase [Candidatus Latescibacteria bacterium]|nr:amidohydrolase/deacetylase family metallohydrolase [Candidatus Latescibacterota bacterium]
MERRKFFKNSLAGGALLGNAAGLTLSSPALAQESRQEGRIQEHGKYDILLKGGHVIDPANSIDDVMDVAIKDGKIALVGENIPTSAVKQEIDNEGAKKIIDVAGYCVTPGFIDIHAHVYHTHFHVPSVIARDVCFNSGCTTIVDVGTAGANNFEDFKRVIIDEPSNGRAKFWQPRILAFLNIAATGMKGDQSPEQFNVPLAVKIAKKYPDIIVGIKSAHYNGGKYEGLQRVWASVEEALEAGRQTNLPAMFDWAQRPAVGRHPARSYREMITKKMRPGDIHTHYQAKQFPIILENGKVNPDLFKARERGVIFDVGHGSGSMVFRHAVRAIKQGFPPDSISTDLHGRNSNSPVYNMINVMSKFLCMGLSLEDVIRLSTVNPARIIKRPELGTLSVGSSAEIAVIEMLEGKYHYTDCSPGQDLTGGGRLTGDKKLVPIMTVFNGNIVFDPTGLSYRDWENIPQNDQYWEGQTEGMMW